MFDKIYKDKNKFSNMKDNFNFKVTLFITNLDKLECRQMPIFMTLLLCWLVRLKCIILLITVTLLLLTHFLLIYSYFLSVLNSNILIQLNGRHLALIISSQPIPLYLQLNAVENFVLSWILYNKMWILYIIVLYTFIKTLFEYIKVILFLTLTLPIFC